MELNLDQMSTEDIAHVNALCREHVGKPLENCCTHDLARVRKGIAEHLLMLRLEREMAIDTIAEITGLSTDDIEAIQQRARDDDQG